MTTPALLLPNTDLVGSAWLKRNPHFASRGVAVVSQLPDDETQFRKGIIQATVVGGAPDLYTRMRNPVVTVSAWAAPAAGSSKVPWPQAFQLAEWAWEQTHDGAHQGVLLTFSLPGYARARVHTVTALSEPRRVPGDQGGYARVDLDVEINWTGEPA